MRNPEQFFNGVYQVNQDIVSRVALSLRKIRVKSCQDFLALNPNLQAYFWVRSNLDYSLLHTSNLKYTMGYDSMTAKQSIQIIHPDHVGVFYRICLALSSFCASGNTGRSLLHFSFVINLPIKDINNKYWYVRQRNSACELNEKNQVLSFLSWHDVLRPYHGEPITIQGYSNQGIRVFEIEETLKKQAGYYKALPFTKRQQEILKIYIRLDEPEAYEVAHFLGIAKETIYTHNRDMLQRARKKYKKSFRDIYHLADFFEQYEVFSR